MSTQRTSPQCSRPGAHEQARLERAEGDGDVGVDRLAGDDAGVGLDPAGHVDGDDGRRSSLGRRDQLVGRRAQATVTADADDPVQDQFGPVDARCGAAAPVRGVRSAAGLDQRGPAALVGPVGREQHGIHPSSAAGQRGPGVERVAAVVAGAHQEHHPPAVHRAEQADALDGQPGRGPGHERAVGQRRHQLGLGGLDLVGSVRRPHPSAPFRDDDGRGQPAVV